MVRSGALASARSRGARAAPTPEYLITTTTALIYLRISANRTSEHASIEQQRADCTTLAGQLGYTRAIEFVDEAISAYQDRARPGYQQLLHQIQESEAGTVIVWHLDRLYRKPRELEQLLDLLDIHPIRVESAQGGSFDLNRHEGRLFARQLVAFANYESAHKGARVARAQQHRARAGLLHGGRHYGHNSDGTLHPVESTVVRRIVDDYLLGLSPTVIARALIIEHIPAPRANKWHTTTIRAILHSDRLHLRRWDRADQRAIPGTWQSVLTPAESALVQVTLLLPRQDAARSSRTLLGGILVCPRCEARLVSGVTRHGTRIYTCRTATTRCPSASIDAAQADAHTEATILEMLATTAPPVAQRPHELLQAIHTARLRLTALATNFGAGDLDHHDYLSQRVPLADALTRGAHELTLHNQARILALHPAELRRRWEWLPFRRAAACALLSFAQRR